MNIDIIIPKGQKSEHSPHLDQQTMNALNYLLVNGMCCCLNICCKEVWETLYKLIGKHAFIKFAYCLVYFSSVLLSILFISLIAEWSWFMQYFAPGIDCLHGQQQDMINCLSASIVYRVCSGLLLLSVLLLCVLMGCSTRVALIFNQGLFFSKFVIVGILTAIFLQVDSQYFGWFGNISQIFSYIFVACQSMIIIDLAYLWGIAWARKYSRGSNFYAFLLIFFTALMFAVTVYLLYSRFQADNHETLKWADILCLLQIATMIGVQLLNFNKQNSLLTTSALCILVAYCTWAAGNSHPSTNSINEEALYLNMGVSFLLLVFSTCGSIYGASKSAHHHDDGKEEMIDLDDPPTEYNNLNNNQIEDAERQRGYWVQWMLYLAGMSMYMAMIVTDWGSADIVTKQFNLTTEAWSSKLVMGNVVFAMYVWSLVAPRVCPNRNFYFQ